MELELLQLLGLASAEASVVADTLLKASNEPKSSEAGTRAGDGGNLSSGGGECFGGPRGARFQLSKQSPENFIMLVFYRGFGLVANVALTLNLMLLVACMSILSATLTLPGIAGIVLTVGMAVDANVLIFERIKEELKAGVPPQSAINAGYGRAFVSIFDANITTLLVAVILFAMGSGPVKGFAVTLCIGILTSMFSGLMVSRGIVNLVYGGRRVEKLSIGGKLENA